MASEIPATHRKVALVGYGYWGKNLARVLHQLGVLTMIVDQRPDLVQPPGMDKVLLHTAFSNYGDLVGLDGVDSVFIATPPETHFKIASEVLMAGAHVFVEKPLATSAAEARELYNMAVDRKLALATGHIYLHCSGIKAMPVPVGPATLSVKLLNPQGGPSPSTQDMLWGALPHAISLCYHLFRVPPTTIEAPVFTHREMQLVFQYWNGSKAYIEVADHTGSKKRLVEMGYGNQILRCDVSKPNMLLSLEARGWLLRDIEITLPQEPLAAECQAFLEQTEPDPMGVRVVETICSLVERWETRLGRV